MKEKDKDLAGGVIYQINKERRGHQMGDCAGDKCPDWITRQVAIITDTLTTVRKEAREAAFKEAVKWAKKVETVKRNAARDASVDDEFAAMRLAHEADGAQRVTETLEAAANREEEAGDG